jgi:hypothetical protein
MQPPMTPFIIVGHEQVHYVITWRCTKYTNYQGGGPMKNSAETVVK